MNEPIKVLHVVGRMDRGGTETLIMNLLRTIDRSEFQYDIVEQTQDMCDYDEEILSLGSQIYRCPHISQRNLGEYREWWRKFFAEHPEYKIVHGHSRGSAPIYLDEAKKAERITIAHCHSSSHGKGIKGLIRYIWQLPLRKIADYNFACSYEAGVSQYGETGRFEVIKNGIQTDKFAWNPKIRKRIRAELGLKKELLIGNVSRFETPKNHLFLISIFKCIKDRNDDAKLILVGQGTLENEIREKAKSLGIDNDIIFTGVRADVNELLQAMDAFVFPSIYEGLPVSLIEAQTSGVPCFISEKVIATEVKVTDVLEFISLEKSPEYWAEQILSGVIPESERADHSAEVIAAGFDIKSTAQRLNEFYTEVLKNE